MANKDLFARVTVTDKASSGFPIPGTRSDVLVKIPFEVAVSLCGSQNPAYSHIKMRQRFMDAALYAKGRKGATNITREAADVVHATVNPSDLSSPDWKDESGVEAWLLPPTNSA